jgi:threonine/homoserine/homoserine lactone efflux protein
VTPWEWLTLASVCFAGAASPGPSLAVVVAAVVGGGRPAGLSAAWAHASGVGLYAAMTVMGISAVLRHAPRLLDAVQIAGALYLLWLATGLLRSRGDNPGSTAGGVRHAARDGFAVAFLNPKLAIFMLALFSQFVNADATLGTGTILVATATLIDGCWYSLVTLLLSQPRFLASLQRRARLIDRVFGGLLAALGTYILVLTLS